MSDDGNDRIPIEKPWDLNPELRELPWVKDFDRAVANSKRVSGVFQASEMPRVPINLLLAVMKEAASRPEIMAAYASAPIDGQIPKKDRHLLMWHGDYLSHKYGNMPDPVREMIVPMCRLANGYYTGLDDPKLVADLISRNRICEDDGVDYG